MDLPKLTPEVARAGLRALKTVATSDGTFHELERSLISAVQTHILGTSLDIDALEPIEAGELASLVVDPTFRERLVNACVVAALIDGEASGEEVALLDGFAAALEIDSAALQAVHHLVDEHLLRLRFDIARRSFVGQRVQTFVGERGPRGIASVIRSLLDMEHGPTAATYRALESKPAGSLGRAYFDFVLANGFSFPGEKGGAPEPIVFHDCLHVLGEYGTSDLEETQIASFQAGMLKKDPMFGLMFMLAQFHLGIQVTPVTEAKKMKVDPELMLRAFARGTRVNMNLCVDWSPEDDFDRPVDELRREYAIEPRG